MSCMPASRNTASDWIEHNTPTIAQIQTVIIAFGSHSQDDSRCADFDSILRPEFR